MNEWAAEAKTLLKQAKENLKKAEEARYNEKVRAEFGTRCRELLDATKEGKNNISFDVTLSQQECIALQDLFLKEGLSVKLYETNGSFVPSPGFYYFDTWINGYITGNCLNSKEVITFVVSVP
jgi:hypothetical protein